MSSDTYITYIIKYLFLFATVRRPLTFETFYFQLLFQNNQDYFDRIWFVATYVEKIHNCEK